MDKTKLPDSGRMLTAAILLGMLIAFTSTVMFE